MVDDDQVGANYACTSEAGSAVRPLLPGIVARSALTGRTATAAFDGALIDDCPPV